MPKETRIGVLALQGAVTEHLAVFTRLGVRTVPVRRPDDLEHIDGLVIPGGESTTVGKLMDRYGLLEAVRERVHNGMALWGTCTGMILMSDRVQEGVAGQPALGVFPARVRRNAFGRQRESFEAGLEVPELGPTPFPGVFIRAPILEEVGSDVEVLVRFEGQIVGARKGNLLVLAFHPELTPDDRFHRLFLEMAAPVGTTARRKQSVTSRKPAGKPARAKKR